MNQQNASNPLTDNVIEEIKERRPSLHQETVLPILSQRAMFWRPVYDNENSAWVEHIPFAFWMIEAHRPRTFVELGTHQGASYFAFCQAVERLGLDTHCFAVDTWKGDEHSGFYNGKVFEKVRAHNEAQYSGFSRLVRSTFDEALDHFEDGTIDLLHIDGLHTFEAVKHDFDTWLPKLSTRAVVVMHDINVRERNFGVFKLFAQLKEQYPAFEFAHGHGLGVLGVGKIQSASLQSLYQSNTKQQERSAIHQTFGRLGRACADARATVQSKTRINELSNQINTQKKQLEKMKQTLESTKAELKTRTSDLKKTKTHMTTQADQQAVERSHLEERIALLQELRIESQSEIARINGRGSRASDSHDKLTRQTPKLKRRLNKAKKTIKGQVQKIDKLINKLSSSKREAQRLKEELGKIKQSKSSLKNELQKQANALENHETNLRAREKASNQKQKQIEQLKKELREQSDSHEMLEVQHTKEIEQTRKDHKSIKKDLSNLEERNRDLASEKQELAKKLEDRFKELATLTKMLEERDGNPQGKRETNTSSETTQKTSSLKINLKENSKNHRWKPKFIKAKKKSTSIKKQAKILQESNLFDKTWYLTQYPDVAKEGADPIEHYLWHGVTDGRNPGPDFDTAHYLESYPDVAKAETNPLIHYIQFGRDEGRVADKAKHRVRCHG